MVLDARTAIDKLKSSLCFHIADCEPYDDSEDGEDSSPEPDLRLGRSGAALESLYSLGPTLGTGLTGVVRLAEETDTGAISACKTITKDKLNTDDLQSEIRSMQSVAGHCHVVQLHALFEDKKSVHLIMDLCSGGDLYSYIRGRHRLGEADAARIFRQAASALEHCHRRAVVHRDVKPENILLAGKVRNPDGTQSPIVKLADFGLAVRLESGQKVKGRVGSVAYMAPEVIRGEMYGFEADVWSLGSALYVALTGYMSFWGEGTDEIFKKICQNEADFTRHPWPSISSEAKNLVKWMMTKNSKNRATAYDVLNHPWIKKHSLGTPPPSPRLYSPFPSPTPSPSHSPSPFPPPSHSLHRVSAHASPPSPSPKSGLRYPSTSAKTIGSLPPSGRSLSPPSDFPYPPSPHSRQSHSSDYRSHFSASPSRNRQEKPLPMTHPVDLECKFCQDYGNCGNSIDSENIIELSERKDIQFFYKHENTNISSLSKSKLSEDSGKYSAAGFPSQKTEFGFGTSQNFVGLPTRKPESENFQIENTQLCGDSNVKEFKFKNSATHYVDIPMIPQKQKITYVESFHSHVSSSGSDSRSEELQFSEFFCFSSAGSLN